MDSQHLLPGRLPELPAEAKGFALFPLFGCACITCASECYIMELTGFVLLILFELLEFAALSTPFPY